VPKPHASHAAALTPESGKYPSAKYKRALYDSSSPLNALVSDLGLAAHCCDFTFENVISPNGQKLANGSKPTGNNCYSHRTDMNWTTVGLPQNGSVYVLSSEFPAFMRRFQELPSTARITLVTGMEDVSAPFEVFTSDKYWRRSAPYTDYFWRFDTTWGEEPKSPWYDGAGGAGKSAAELGTSTPQEIYRDQMQAFLRDDRLNHWFTQNYDFSGCTYFGNALHTERIEEEACHDSTHLFDSTLTSKLTPIPIGVDHWPPGSGGQCDPQPLTGYANATADAVLLKAAANVTAWKNKPLEIAASFDCDEGFERVALRELISSKGHEVARTVWSRYTALYGDVYRSTMGNNTCHMPAGNLQDDFGEVITACFPAWLYRKDMSEEQKTTLDAIVADMPGLDKYQMTLTSKPSRADACWALNKLKQTTGESLFAKPLYPATEQRKHKQLFYENLGHVRFVLSPQGHGLDSYRFWQTLVLGAVPVVVTSSLDSMYSQYPCVILNSWSELANLTTATMQTWSETIESKFPDFVSEKGGGAGDDSVAGTVAARLTLEHWVGLIKAKKEEAFREYS